MFRALCRTSIIIFVSLFVWTGCKKKTTPTKKRTAPKKKNLKRASTKKATSHKYIQMLEKYEVIRKALAYGKLKEAKAGIDALVTALKAQVKKNDKHESILDPLANAALQMKSAPEFMAAAKAFGEVSKHTVRFLLATKQTQGIQSYFCPMAKGYKRWIQLDNKMANPYMGYRKGLDMLKCGAKEKKLTL